MRSAASIRRRLAAPVRLVFFVFLLLLHDRAAVANDDDRRDSLHAAPEDYLDRANTLLANGDAEEAIEAYRAGLEALVIVDGSSAQDSRGGGSEDPGAPSVPSSQRPNNRGVTELSLHTNLATALSSLGRDDAAIEAYQQALVAYHRHFPATEHVPSGSENSASAANMEPRRAEAASIAAQASFYLGMMYQDKAAESLVGEAGGSDGEPRRGGTDGNAVREAIDAYRYASHLDPLLWSASANLGSLYHDVLMDHERALEAYGSAYDILTGAAEPTDPPPEPRPILSQLQYRIGLCLSHDLNRRCRVVSPDGDDRSTGADCKELATHAFAMAIEYDDTNAAAKHMLATLTADATMKRASNEYVTTLFDEYATNFEHSLVAELGYNGYERLRRAFDRAFEPRRPPMFDLVLDAGCGTGLVGMEFRNVSRRLVGVDLSQAIIDQAVSKRPGLYDETRAGDVIEVLNEKSSAIDLIVAGDSFIYFGDLDPLFDALHVGLADGGFAAFTLEDVDLETEETLGQSKPDWRWQLTASGRFAHRMAYVNKVALTHELRPVHYERMDGFRHERGAQVRGHIFIVQKVRPDQEL